MEIEQNEYDERIERRQFDAHAIKQRLIRTANRA